MTNISRQVKTIKLMSSSSNCSCRGLVSVLGEPCLTDVGNFPSLKSAGWLQVEGSVRDGADVRSWWGT